MYSSIRISLFLSSTNNERSEQKKNEKQTANLVTIVRQLTHPV